MIHFGKQEAQATTSTLRFFVKGSFKAAVGKICLIPACCLGFSYKVLEQARLQGSYTCSHFLCTVSAGLTGEALADIAGLSFSSVALGHFTRMFQVLNFFEIEGKGL